MKLDYTKIAEVNKGIAYTDVRGKNYAEVAQRVQAFRKLIPDGYITTDILKMEDGIVYMKAEAGYYENGQRVMLATGYAFERQDASNINKTSYIENCETSAVGRALGFLGLGSEKSICSREELENAVMTQEAIESGKIPDPAKRAKPKAEVTTSARLPAAKTQQEPEKKPEKPAKPSNPVLDYLAREREDLRIVRELTAAENNAIWKQQLAVLAKAGLIPNKAFSEYSMEEAKDVIRLMYGRFDPKGVELKDERETA